MSDDIDWARIIPLLYPKLENDIPSPPTNEAPSPLCPDPQLGTRDGWKFCDTCAGIKPPEHQHDGLEEKTHTELVLLAREFRDALCRQPDDRDQRLYERAWNDAVAAAVAAARKSGWSCKELEDLTIEDKHG